MPKADEVFVLNTINDEDEKIYRKVEHIYLTQDAIDYTTDWLWNNEDLTEEERQKIWSLVSTDYLVERFMDKRDIEIGDWYTWTYLVQDYLVGIIDYLDGTEVVE